MLYYFCYYCYRPLIEERSYRDRYRDRSNERFRERRGRDRDKDRDRDRNRSRERRDVAPHYIEPPIHVPIYYVRELCKSI